MDRTRFAVSAALIAVLAIGTLGSPIAGVGGAVSVAAAVPSWPTSTLVISEIQTGGASASDEFVEIANQGAAGIDLVGLEVVYATSSGSTVTRKATWAATTVLEPGRRFLIANGAGVVGTAADAVYTGGFAATGGSVALRVVGGTVIDAVGWGDATNAFVEGSPAVAPPSSSSLERRPGGAAGNGVDTNDNAPTCSSAPSRVRWASPHRRSRPGSDTDADTSPTPTATPTPTPRRPPRRHRPRPPRRLRCHDDADPGCHADPDSHADRDADPVTDTKPDARADPVAVAVAVDRDRCRPSPGGRRRRPDRGCPDDVARRPRRRANGVHPGRVSRDRDVPGCGRGGVAPRRHHHPRGGNARHPLRPADAAHRRGRARGRRHRCVPDGVGATTGAANEGA